MKKILVLTIIFITSSSYAFTYHGSYNCGQLLTMDRNNNEYAKDHVISWFEGYATARNYILSNELDDFDSDSIYYATIKYCKENPLDKTYHAADYIYSKLENE